jgi:predicted Fe-Mo cluster-binding NifX family protein
MKKRIAVPTSNGLLDEHFGHCKQFVMIDVDGQDILKETIVDAPPHQPGLLPPWLAEQGVTDVIAGGMGQRAIQIFNDNGVNVFVGAPKMTPAELAEGFIQGTLSFNANYCDH